jgi:hypothetical protein
MGFFPWQAAVAACHVLFLFRVVAQKIKIDATDLRKVLHSRHLPERQV